MRHDPVDGGAGDGGDRMGGIGAARRPTDRLRVVTWNLWWRYGDWRARREAIVAEIRRLDPDLCGLQEVWDGGGENLAGALAAELGWHWAWGPSPAPERWRRRLGRDGVGIGVGNAILSRWPIVDAETIALPSATGIDDGRLLLRATVAAPVGEIAVFTTQLTSAWGHSRIRQEQVAAICRAIAGRGPAAFPPILTGDFNAPPDADEIRALVGKAAPSLPGFVLLDAWGCARPLEPGWTWDRRNPHVAATLEPDARCDYVFVGLPQEGGRGHVLAVELVGTGPRGGTWPSDHFGVLAELRAGVPH